MLPAGMSPMDKLRLSQWIKSGCPAASVEILQRPSAVSYPNTFVIMWKNPIVAGAKAPIAHICLDVHYDGAMIEAGKAIQALGGFWAQGINGALKPEQDLTLKPLLIAKVPATSPDPTSLAKFGNY